MTKRDIGEEILQSLKDLKAGKGIKSEVLLPQDIKNIREVLNLSQANFATLLSVSIRTLQEWEQGRRAPSGPAYSLLKIAQKHPEVFLDTGHSDEPIMQPKNASA